MDTSLEGEFFLHQFSPQSLTFIPDLNCVLASDRCGKIRYVDLVSGEVQECPDIFLPPSSRPSPVHVTFHPFTNKVVVASSGLIGGRCVHKGCVLLKSILQTPVQTKNDEVMIEIPTEEVEPLLRELRKSTLRSSSLSNCAKDLIRQLSSTKLAEAHPLQASKCCTTIFKGSLGKLSELFNDMVVTRQKAPSSQSSKTSSSSSSSSSLPLAARLAFRLHLLHSEQHAKISKIEKGELRVNVSNVNHNMMNVEGLRVLSLSDWPHNYEWAVPRAMAEAGFYLLGLAYGNAAQADRVTCFSCRVYLYSWEPMDEPWSEHERHAMQCPYIRGEYTDNVPLVVTEASHPAHHCLKDREDRIMCIGTSIGTELVAVGTERGCVILMDMDHGLLITECATLQLTTNILQQWLEKHTHNHSPDSTSETLADNHTSAAKNDNVDGDTDLKAPSTSTEPSKEDQVVPSLAPDDDNTIKQKPSATLDCETPTSKHDLHITSLSVFKQVLGTPATPDSAETSCSMLITGVTMRDTQNRHLFPMLVVHQVKVKKHSLAKTKPLNMGGGAFVQNADFLEMNEPIPSNLSMPIPTQAQENAVVTFDVVSIMPFMEYACDLDSGLVPEVSQIIPLDNGRLLAVACTASNDNSNPENTFLHLYKIGPGMKGIISEPSAGTLFHSPRVHFSPIINDNETGRILLASLSSCGELVICDCAGGELFKLSTYQCKGVGDDDQFTSCVYCPTTSHLFVSSKSGKLLKLKWIDKEDIAESKEDVEESSDASSYVIDRILHLEDFDNLLNLMRCSHLSVPFRCMTPAHWKEISLLELNRQSPLHINTPPEQLHHCHWKGPGKKKNVDNSRILQYEPPVTPSFLKRYEFEVILEGPRPVPLGCVSIKLSFANACCISENATFSLFLPEVGTKKSASSAKSKETTPRKLLCGPMKLKPLISVTEQSLQLYLVHPLLLVSQTQVLLLTFEHLFPSEYKDIAVFEVNAPGGSEANSRRQAWKHRAFRHHVQQSLQSDSNKYSVPVQANLIVNVFPVTASVDSLKQSPLGFSHLTASIRDPSFILRVAVAACNAKIEHSELRNLPAALQSSVREGQVPLSKEAQEKAFDLLLWMGCVHCVSAEDGGYAVMSGAVSQLLLSLMYSCYLEGNRLLAHKCSQLIMMLYRSGDESDLTNQFRFMLSESLTHLLPLLPLFSSASCVHWFLRLLSTLTTPPDTPCISNICKQLLVDLSRVLSMKNSLPAQILQTNFKHEGSVFEPELFDIYLSYCQKSSFTTKAKPVQSGGNPYGGNTQMFFPPGTALPLSMDLNFNPLEADAGAINWSAPTVLGPGASTGYLYLPSTQGAVTSSNQSAFSASSLSNIPPGTTHIVTDKSGHTIYDSELQLLLDSSKKTKKNQEKKFIEEFTTYKHGSFLLYSQRGLLETLPLAYMCLSVSGNATVLEPSIHTLPHVPENQSQQPQVSLISKTSGYKYPIVHTDQEKTFQNRISNSTSNPIPQILADISASPKELVMQIDSLKSGVAYSALLKFPQPVLLTDISIPATGSMSSVSVDVWLNEGGEKSEGVRVAQSLEIKTRSLMLGSLTPRPLCQYVKVTFLGSLVNTKEMTQVFIGAFYGIPFFSVDQSPSVEQLQSLEERLLSQYYLYRDSLTSALLSYTNLHGNTPCSKQYEERVNRDYQQCYKTQVCLARLRNFKKSLNETKHGSDDQSGAFGLPDVSDIDYQQYSISKLSKLIGCLVDTLLALNSTPPKKSADNLTPTSAQQNELDQNGVAEDEGFSLDAVLVDQLPMLTEDECKVLFNALCIHGIPKMHARAIALLIKFGGSQNWWGEFVIKMAIDLFGTQQTAIFNKERALLQLSALSQHTYSTSDLLPRILHFLQDKLSHFMGITDQTVLHNQNSDHSLLCWVIMLLSHFLSSVVSSNSLSNLFVPLPINPPTVDMASDKVDIKETLTRSQYISQHELNKKLEALWSQRESLCSPSTASVNDLLPSPSKEQTKPDPVLANLPQDLCHSVIRGLVKYVLALCKGEADSDFIPVLSKLISLLLSSTKWSYPLHTLVTQQELNVLLSYATSNVLCNTSSNDSASQASILEWHRRTLQNLCMSMLYYGEVRPSLKLEKQKTGEIESEKPEPAAIFKVKTKTPSTSMSLSSFRLKRFAYHRNQSSTSLTEEKKQVSRVKSVHYHTFIISSTIEYRSLCMPQYLAELQLQKVAREVYRSILSTLLSPKPLSPSLVKPQEEDVSTVDDMYLETAAGSNHGIVFQDTISMLSQSLENLLKSATDQHQLLNDTDLLTVLSLWHELNTVLLASGKEDQAAQPIASRNCYHILVDFLISSTCISPAMWQLSLVNILTSLGAFQKEDQSVDYDKLVLLLVKFFLFSPFNVTDLIRKIVRSLIDLKVGLFSTAKTSKLSGSCLLLEVFITALQKRDTAIQDYSFLSDLSKTMREEKLHEALRVYPEDSLSHVLHLVHALCELVAELVPDALNENSFPGVKLFGAEVEESRRKQYVLINELHKRTWNPTKTSTIGLKEFSSQLFHLLTSILSVDLRTTDTDSLQQYCHKNFCKEAEKHVDYSKLARTKSLSPLAVVYADSNLLFKYLQILNLISAHSNKTGPDQVHSCHCAKPKPDQVNSFHDFILFLYNSCEDLSCFFQPIQRVLDHSPGDARLSKLFISLITQHPTLTDGQKHGLSKMHEFILSGGGLMVLKGLMGCSKQTSSMSSNKDLFIHAISKLGHKDSPPKTISDSCSLVDFFSLSTCYLNSSKGMVKVTQSSKTTTPLFQYTFKQNEKWVQLHVVLPHPILLHNFICYLPVESGSATPSMLTIDCSLHGGPNSAVPVTPVFKTDSLKLVNVAFQLPVLVQHMVVHFHRPLLSASIVLSRVEILGTSFGNSAETIVASSVSTPSLTQQDREQPGSGWLDIVDQWLSSSSPETVQAVKSLFGDLPDLLPSCLALLNSTKHTDRKFASQLENLLIALAEDSADHGVTVLHYLFGFSLNKSLDGQDPQNMSSEDITFSFRLLSELCKPTSNVSRQRLSTSLRLLSNLPPSKTPPGSHLPRLMCALSHMIWHGKSMESICSEETFRSLVELAFSLEPGSRYKASLNALLCSLCSSNQQHFSLLLAACEDVLITGIDKAGHRLNTLAQAAQSVSSTKILLESELLSRMISRLTNGFEKLLHLVCHPVTSDANNDEKSDVPLKENARDVILYLCSLLAFFTDFLRNWRPGKTWMASSDNHRFWSPMLQFLSMETSIVSPLEISFIQEVSYEFFSVCILGCDDTKEAFVKLVCNALRNEYSFNSNISSDRILTPFLHKLLVGIIFQHETIPIILRVIAPSDSNVDTESPLFPLSLPSTTESQEFHPSYPIGESCYYLHVPGSSSLSQFESLVLSHKMTKLPPSKPEPKTTEKTVRKGLGGASVKPPTTSTTTSTSTASAVAKSTLAPSSTSNLDVASFELKHWKIPAPGKEVAKDGKGEKKEKRKRMDYDILGDIVPKGLKYPLTVVMDNKVMLFNAEHSTKRPPDMYNLFILHNGLLPLAQSIPALYPYHWPSFFASNGNSKSSSDATPRGIFKTHTIFNPPSVLPFRSVLMLGVCLQLEGFGKVLGENPSAAFMLLSLLFGEEKAIRDSFPKVFTESLSYLPYLVFLESLRKFPGHCVAGRSLRRKVHQVGLLQLVLQCLASAGHHSPRLETDASITNQISLAESNLQPKKIASSVDRQYWAKGTGFGTGSTTTSYNMVAVRAKHKLEEKYVSICFAILSEFFSFRAGGMPSTGGQGEKEGGVVGQGGGVGDEDAFLPSDGSECFDIELIELLCKSCVLPALASYLLNDSVLDISKHIELYQMTLSLVSSLATNPATQHLLTLPVFSVEGGGASSEGVTSLASLLAKLREIAIIYQRTAKIKEPKAGSKKDSIPLPPKRTASLGVTIPTSGTPSPPQPQDKEDTGPSVATTTISTHTISSSTAVGQLMSQSVGSDIPLSTSTEEQTLVQFDVLEEYDVTVPASENEGVQIEVPDTKDEEENVSTASIQSKDDDQKDIGDSIASENLIFEESGKEEDLKEVEEKKSSVQVEGDLKSGVPTLDCVKEQAATGENQAKDTAEELKSGAAEFSEHKNILEELALTLDPSSLPPMMPVVSQPTVPQTVPLAPSQSHSKVMGIKKLHLSKKPEKISFSRTSKSPAKDEADEADLAELITKILSVSEIVAGVVQELKREAGSYSRQSSSSAPLTPLAESSEGVAASYMKAMKPLQFDTYQITREDENGRVTFTCPFHYQSQVENSVAATHDAARARRLAQEISTLSTSLPLSPSSSVFARCDEERLDIMKVLITGPSDTPYANGCFEFDVFFPTDYPKSPMLVNLKTTGHGRVRFNPNLYNDGKVCLSVLNTWHGRPEEKWNGQTSSLLQVLVSIQSLILVPEPYFNEPGYEQSRGTLYGDQKSLAYSSNISVATIMWAMINQIRNPTPCFRQVILQHFYLRKDSIFSQYEAWKVELEEGIKRIKQGGASVHLLKEHLHSLDKSMETLKIELNKIKEEDFQLTDSGGGGRQ